jgi:uncharacterized protein (TIGR02246 family)
VIIRLLFAGVGFVAGIGLAGQNPDDDQAAHRAVQSFYDAFNSHGFEHAADFTTDDWNHINPAGGWTRGRENVLKELKQVHNTFLKAVTDTPGEISVRFATSQVAVATVPSNLSTFTTPDGVKHEKERQIRTFVLVKRAGRWLIMQDQNTVQR